MMESEPTANKAEYVRRQKQVRNHHCHWPGCTKEVPPAMWGCKTHWFRLPRHLRNRIWAAYRPGQEIDMTPSDEYLAVANEVREWCLENDRGETGLPRNISCGACSGRGRYGVRRLGPCNVERCNWDDADETKQCLRCGGTGQEPR
jgi:hypothetical protein